jgi:hypothetical protein
MELEAADADVIKRNKNDEIFMAEFILTQLSNLCSKKLIIKKMMCCGEEEQVGAV